MSKLIARLPERRSVIGVYAVTAFLVYGWTLLASFWKVPSWLYFLKLGEILSVYAYSFVIDFGESVLLLFLVLLIGLLLPKRWWNEQFTPKSAVWVSVLLGSIMLRLYTNRAPEYWEDFVYNQGAWWGYTLMLGIVLSTLFSRVSWLRKGLETLADRLVVFLYVYMPLTALSIIVVLLRNIY
jgi:hypothetical protein